MATEADVMISFPGVDAGTANDLAGELADYLAEEAPTAAVDRRREDPLTQDFGATLVIVLGATAVGTLAKGVAAWIARRQDAELHVRRVTPDGQVREATINGQVSARAERVLIDFFER